MLQVIQSSLPVFLGLVVANGYIYWLFFPRTFEFFLFIPLLISSVNNSTDLSQTSNTLSDSSLIYIYKNQSISWPLLQIFWVRYQSPSLLHTSVRTSFGLRLSLIAFEFVGWIFSYKRSVSLTHLQRRLPKTRRSGLGRTAADSLPSSTLSATSRAAGG